MYLKGKYNARCQVYNLILGYYWNVVVLAPVSLRHTQSAPIGQLAQT